MNKRKLTSIERDVLSKITDRIKAIYNDGVLENFDSFYEEDIEFRKDMIYECIKLLQQEKEYINMIISE